MKLELLDCADSDYGSYLRARIGAGDVVAEVNVEDGVHGRKVTVEVNGKLHVIDVAALSKPSATSPALARP